MKSIVVCSCQKYELSSPKQGHLLDDAKIIQIYQIHRYWAQLEIQCQSLERYFHQMKSDHEATQSFYCQVATWLKVQLIEAVLPRIAMQDRQAVMVLSQTAYVARKTIQIVARTQEVQRTVGHLWLCWNMELKEQIDSSIVPNPLLVGDLFPAIEAIQTTIAWCKEHTLNFSNKIIWTAKNTLIQRYQAYCIGWLIQTYKKFPTKPSSEEVILLFEETINDFILHIYNYKNESKLSTYLISILHKKWIDLYHAKQSLQSHALDEQILPNVAKDMIYGMEASEVVEDFFTKHFMLDHPCHRFILEQLHQYEGDITVEILWKMWNQMVSKDQITFDAFKKRWQRLKTKLKDKKLFISKPLEANNTDTEIKIQCVAFLFGEMASFERSLFLTQWKKNIKIQVCYNELMDDFFAYYPLFHNACNRFILNLDKFIIYKNVKLETLFEMWSQQVDSQPSLTFEVFQKHYQQLKKELNTFILRDDIDSVLEARCMAFIWGSMTLKERREFSIGLERSYKLRRIYDARKQLVWLLLLLPEPSWQLIEDRSPTNSATLKSTLTQQGLLWTNGFIGILSILNMRRWIRLNFKQLLLSLVVVVTPSPTHFEVKSKSSKIPAGITYRQEVNPPQPLLQPNKTSSIRRSIRPIKTDTLQNAAATNINQFKSILDESYNNLVFVQGGVYEMGSSNSNDFAPLHMHSVNHFFISKYEVTFDEYNIFCDEVNRRKPDNDDFAKGNHPVFNVNWYDAIAYCNWLSRKHKLQLCYEIDSTRQDSFNLNKNDLQKWIVRWDTTATGFRLPTEAEWEYAARGGQAHQNTLFAGSNNRHEVGWFAPLSNKQTHPVGLKQPNELGLYDMSGNVWEWCWDKWGAYGSDEPQFDHRIDRGGSWGDTLKTVSTRGGAKPSYRGRDERDSGAGYDNYGHIGFRVARNK